MARHGTISTSSGEIAPFLKTLHAQLNAFRHGQQALGIAKPTPATRPVPGLDEVLRGIRESGTDEEEE